MKAFCRCLILLTVACLAGCCPGDLLSSADDAGLAQSTAGPSRLGAAPDPRFNRQFTRLGDGWTGADGTYSVALPDGRTVWMFGDTFLGRVNPDRSRPADTPPAKIPYCGLDRSYFLIIRFRIRLDAMRFPLTAHQGAIIQGDLES